MTTVAPPVDPQISALLFADRLITLNPPLTSVGFRFGVSTLGTDTFEGPTTGGPTIDHGVVLEVASAGMIVGATAMTEQGSVLESAFAYLIVGAVGAVVSGGGAIVFAASGTATTVGGTFSSTGTGAVNFGGTASATLYGGDPEVGFIPVD